MGFLDRFKSAPKPPQCPPEVIEEQRQDVIRQFVEGKLDAGQQTNVIPKQGERLIVAIPGISLAEERAPRRGSYRGVTVRLARGFSVHSGGYQQPVAQVTEIDEGTLTLTSKRLVFSGSGQSRDFKLSAINSILPLEDGIGINRAGKSKTECYLGTTQISLNCTITPDPGDEWAPITVPWKLDGTWVKTIIERLIGEA